jgi:hypothetical protein
LTRVVRPHNRCAHAASRPSTVDARRTTFAGLPIRCAPADKHWTQSSFDPSTEHHRSDRFLVHIPAVHPTTRLRTTLTMITIGSGPSLVVLNDLEGTGTGGAHARGDLAWSSAPTI